VYTLDPTTDAIPWTSRSYSRKRKPLPDQSMVESAKKILVEQTGEGNKVIDGKKEESTSARYIHPCTLLSIYAHEAC